MLRAIVAVIVGYVSLFFAVFTSFSIAYLLMGADRAFQPGLYEVSTLWALTSIVLGLCAAIIGGVVCAVIAGRPTPPRVLAGLVLILGILSAIPALLAGGEPSPTRDAEVGNLEAAGQAIQPAWVALLNPIIGAVGVMIGASMVRTGAPRRD